MILSAQLSAAGAWGKFIPPDYPWIQWQGRIDTLKVGGRLESRFDWAQSGLRFDFDGSAFALYMDALDNNFNVLADGELTAILGPQPKAASDVDHALWRKPLAGEVQTWLIAGLKKGRHHIEVNKRTGANFGTAKVYGLRLDAAATLYKPAAPPARRLEFIGDSLTNAYGCEAKAKECGELRPYENSYQGYAARTARELKAEFQIVALSGFGVIRNYGDKEPRSKDPLPSYYRRKLSSLEQPLVEPASFLPAAIMINLGTNDFSTAPFPAPAEFQAAYAALVENALEGRDRKTPLFVLSVKGVGIQEKSLAETARLLKGQGLDVTLVELPAAAEHELGCDWHPQLAVHQRWADQLSGTLRAHLHW